MDENRRNIENTAGGKSSLLWLPNSIFTAIEKTADFSACFTSALWKNMQRIKEMAELQVRLESLTVF